MFTKIANFSEGIVDYLGEVHAKVDLKAKR
jgi:hypothetical protein